MYASPYRMCNPLLNHVFQSYFVSCKELSLHGVASYFDQSSCRWWMRGPIRRSLVWATPTFERPPTSHDLVSVLQLCMHLRHLRTATFICGTYLTRKGKRLSCSRPTEHRQWEAIGVWICRAPWLLVMRREGLGSGLNQAFCALFLFAFPHIIQYKIWEIWMGPAKWDISSLVHELGLCLSPLPMYFSTNL